MRQTITATSLPLYSLGAFGDVLSRCDSQRFSTLVELTLALLTSGDPIGTVLIHCTRIQSLTLIVSDAYEGDVAAALRTHSDPLPLLTAFQVFYPRMGRKMSESMVSFLRNKLLLERLDMGLHEWPKAFDDIELVLDILPGLPRLRVLGTELSSHSPPYPGALSLGHLQYLSQSIPPRLTALSVWVGAQYSKVTLTKEDWRKFFAGLPSCRFVYFGADHLYPGTGVLRDALFDHPPPLAELVGFGEELAWVERDLGTGQVRYNERWPLSKVHLRTTEDFGCEEWEWLLRLREMWV